MKKENKKKGIAVLLILMMSLFLLTGCGNSNEDELLNNQSNLNQKEEDIDNTIKNETTKKVSSEYYGKFVNYPIDLNNDKDNTNDWKIFYSDENNIFLISADYVLSDSEYLSLDKAGINKVNKFSSMPYSSYIYNVSWKDWDNNTDTANNNGLSDISQSIIDKYMLKTYYDNYKNSSNINVKATASLLNTNNWSRLVDDIYGESAIGSPTLEMWVASWNEKGYTPLYCNNCTAEGYYIGSTDKPETNRLDKISTLDSNGYNDTLYFPHKETYEGCSGYYLASPSANTFNLGGDLKGISPQGIIGNVTYDSCRDGIRPVVALKSNVTIQYESENGVIELICN